VVKLDIPAGQNLTIKFVTIPIKNKVFKSSEGGISCSGSEFVFQFVDRMLSGNE
jgi:hypothetical protein